MNDVILNFLESKALTLRDGLFITRNNHAGVCYFEFVRVCYCGTTTQGRTPNDCNQFSGVCPNCKEVFTLKLGDYKTEERN